MSRLFWLLVALCAAGVVLSSPFLLAAIRAANRPFPPLALLAGRALQTLALSAVAARAGVRFAPRAGLDAPWLRAFAERRERPQAFGSVAIEAAPRCPSLSGGRYPRASGRACAARSTAASWRRR